jgi:hypothetical protein
MRDMMSLWGFESIPLLKPQEQTQQLKTNPSEISIKPVYSMCCPLLAVARHDDSMCHHHVCTPYLLWQSCLHLLSLGPQAREGGGTRNVPFWVCHFCHKDSDHAYHSCHIYPGCHCLYCCSVSHCCHSVYCTVAAVTESHCFHGSRETIMVWHTVLHCSHCSRHFGQVTTCTAVT